MLVMGILNATPDSFADGGEHFTYPDAVDHGLKLIAEGADLIDVGGESTRPGAERVSAAEEERRVINVISKLVDAGKPISIDTMRATTARAAIIAGASVINDVSGGLADAAMLDTAAELKVPYIAMHWRGHSKEMNNLATWDLSTSDLRYPTSIKLAVNHLLEMDSERERLRALLAAGEITNNELQRLWWKKYNSFAWWRDTQTRSIDVVYGETPTFNRFWHFWINYFHFSSVP